MHFVTRPRSFPGVNVSIPVLTKVPPHAGEGQVTDFEALCITWHKSTASNSGGCVEVAIADESIHVRDSVNADGPVLRLRPPPHDSTHCQADA
jgi:Domain of unknown function (DUF397)